MANTSKINEWATDIYNKAKIDNPNIGSLDAYVKLFEGNIHNVGWALLIFSFTIGLTVFFGYCYRESTLDKTFNRAEKLRLTQDIEKSQ